LPLQAILVRLESRLLRVRSGGRAPLLPVLLPYAVFVLLSLLSWNRWIEPYVDSGRELMVPWRVSHGEALYRDVRFYYGPLAPFAAAGADALAGRSLAARIALAAVIALAHIEALRRLAARFLGAARAALAMSLAVGLFFFLRPGGCHLFPYSLDTSIAVAATAWTLALAGATARATCWTLSASLLAALLSRPETGLAAVVAALLPTGPEPILPKRRFALVLAPVGVAGAVYAVLSLQTPIATLRREGWLAFLAVPSEFGRVYASFSGLDRPGLRLAELALAVILLALAASVLAAAAFLSSRAADRRQVRLIEAAGLAILAGASVVFLRPPQQFAESLRLFPPLIRPLPLFVVSGAVWRAVQRVRQKKDTGPFGSVPDGALLVSALFAGRLILAAGYVGPYAAFYLPLPAIVAAAGVFALLDRAARVEGLGASPRLAAGALVLFLTARAADLTAVFRSPAWAKLETSAGSLYLPEPYASATRQVLADLAHRTPAGGPVLGFPEVGFLQYVLGRPSPLPEDQFFPGHLDGPAEEAAIRLIERRPPVAFVYVNVLTIGHGPAGFGTDYLTRLDAAVRRLSRPVASYGPGARLEERIGDPGFFIEVREPVRP
jgi:hypothetical protein